MSMRRAGVYRLTVGIDGGAVDLLPRQLGQRERAPGAAPSRPHHVEVPADTRHVGKLKETWDLTEQG